MRTRREVRRRQYLSTIVGGTVAATAGCLTDGVSNGTDEARVALPGRTLRYGGVVPLSGELEAVGDPLTNATTLP